MKRDTKQTKNNETNENIFLFSFVSFFFVCFVSLFIFSRAITDHARSMQAIRSGSIFWRGLLPGAHTTRRSLSPPHGHRRPRAHRYNAVLIHLPVSVFDEDV